MPWPKGVPRKGHVNKDGKPHARRGEVLTRQLQRATMAKSRVTRPAKQTPAIVPPAETNVKSEKVDDGWRAGRPSIEKCPNCGWAYADGGYCERPCGWTQVAKVGIIRYEGV